MKEKTKDVRRMKCIDPDCHTFLKAGGNPLCMRCRKKRKELYDEAKRA